MKSSRQLDFIDLKVSSLIPPDDPLKVIFNSSDFSFIHSLLKDRYSKIGRQGYDPQSLFKALLLIYLGFASSERDLAEKLRFDGRLTFLCGFSYGETPKHNTFHYFRERVGLELFQEILLNLIAQCTCLIKANKLKLTIDSSHIESFHSDSDAEWGYKQADFSFFGYKVHLEVTNTELPIPTALTITPANEWDGNLLAELTERSADIISKNGKSIKAVIADAGYDSTENAEYLIGKEIIPYIAENPRGRKNPIHRGDIIISPDGRFLCKGGFELCYWGREERRKRIKFRCGLHKSGGAGCLFAKECFKSRYGPTFYLKEGRAAQDRLRAIRRSSSFKKIYKERTTIERLISVLKGTHKLDELRFRGMAKISIHVFFSIASYLCRCIAGLKFERGLLAV